MNRIEKPAPPAANATEILILSLLNDFVYCPRRAALKALEGCRGENEHTVFGELAHEHADLPGYEVDKGVLVWRALPVWSERFGLTGKCDIVEKTPDGLLYPVEYKKGRRRKFENDDIQLCAQALCLEEMLEVAVPEGFIYHAASKRRRRVLFDDRLREETRKAIEEVRQMIAEGRVPAAVLHPRCDGCSLRQLCMPELTGAEASAGRQERYQRELLACDSVPLK